MFLKSVFIRFYKSFNYNYLRKLDPKVKIHPPWEKFEGMLYPYVKIPIERDITAVVGENESGKSHLLDAIERGISGENISREDVCRYSISFTVEAGKMQWPDFGFEWGLNNGDDMEVLKDVDIVTFASNIQSFFLFRNAKTKLSAYIASDGSRPKEVKQEVKQAFIDRLPSVFRLKEDVGLPRSVPIRYLLSESSTQTAIELSDRRRRSGFFSELCDLFSSPKTPEQYAPQIVTSWKGLTSPTSVPAGNFQEELKLARDLIFKVAKVDTEAIRELKNSLENGNDAFANSIIDEINATLARTLNFPHWWVQDSDFRLEVSPRDYDLVFTVRDRTGREYSFDERSSGLKYFLSYYIQYLAHEPPENGRREILLMDEPDAFLSSQGQQDLLKVFDAFARPDSGDPIQVVYVTHSPFLIDKNHAQRIRVLAKGVGDEGTRVVRDVSRNHYEPLRSAFGSFVGETTFIGNCNLMAEGPADQILLAGAARHLRSRDASELETLDLNHMTIVPASGASHIPYLVYLARGRDVEKPAVIVLLDSDEEGTKARKAILHGGPGKKKLLKPEFILQVGDLSETDGLKTTMGRTPIEVEDIIPLSVCRDAAEKYLLSVCDASEDDVAKLTEKSIEENLHEGTSVFKAIQACLAKIGDGFHIEKIGFARCVIETVTKLDSEGGDEENRRVLETFDSNMKVLFRKLRLMQRAANRELTSKQISDRLNRAISAFIQDHPEKARREHAVVLFEEIEQVLDDSLESDRTRNEMGFLRRDFSLNDSQAHEIEKFDDFKQKLKQLRYVERLATQDPEPAEHGSKTESLGNQAPDASAQQIIPTTPSVSGDPGSV